MKTTRLLLAATACLTPAFAGYTYDWASLLNPANASQWTENGSSNVLSTDLYSSNGANGGSIIFGPSVPGTAGSYEVRYTLRLGSNSASGSYLTYLRATTNSEMVTGNTGTFYAVEIANPTFSGSSCSATLNIHKQINNTLTTPYHTAVSCHDGMVVRAVVWGSTNIVIYIDNVWIEFAHPAWPTSII